ncbi:MAG: hypothetical protein WCI27_09900, partial [Candidatus Omnitrophota bacterium]
ESSLWRRLRIHVYGGLCCIGAALMVYVEYFQGQPLYVLWESFPISKAQRTESSMSPWQTVQMAWGKYAVFFLTNPTGIAILSVFVLSAVGFVLYFFKGKYISRREKICSLLAVISMLMFIVTTAHEYLLSGVGYRVYWIFPSLLIFIFLIFGLGFSGPGWNIIFRRVSYAVLLVVAVLMIAYILRDVKDIRQKGNVFKWGMNEVYTHQGKEWSMTVLAACDFIEKNIPPGEKLLTLPFDTLYNFLTGRDQPTRQWVFFEHFFMPSEQDRVTIKDLERHKVKWVLISNRSVENGLGGFGKRYCRILSHYIDANYEPQVQLGVWSRDSSWAWNHGVIFLKRKTPFEDPAALK